MPTLDRRPLAPQEPLPSDNASCPSPSRPTTEVDFAETAKSARKGALGHIAVEGPIGVGKTTLARRLASHLDRAALLEPDSNPFLARYYRNPRRYALPTQLFFLLHRAGRVGELAGPLLGTDVVSDFLMEKDRLFAGMTLDDNEMRLYDRISESLDIEPPTPDLVIYLQAPVSVLLERISRRGDPRETLIDSGYLGRLNETYTRFFHDYDAAPLLIVNAAEIDFAGNAAHFRALANEALEVSGARTYFNPNPTLL